MKKAVFCGIFILCFSLQPALAQQLANDTVLLRRLQEINGQITDIRIKIGEALIGKLENQDGYFQTESMKNFYRIASEYQTFCGCEERVFFMYRHVNANMKVYISAILLESLKKKKKNWDESIKNFQNYLVHLKDGNTIITITELQKKIDEAQSLMGQLITYYAAENAKYRRK